MRKIYTIALCAAVCFTSQAQLKVSPVPAGMTRTHISELPKTVAKSAADLKMSGKLTKISPSGARKANAVSSVDDLAGDYMWNFSDAYTGAAFNQIIRFSAGSTGTQLIISGLFGEYDLTATWVRTGSIRISRQIVCKSVDELTGQEKNVYFSHCGLNEKSEVVSDNAAFVIKVDTATGEMTIDANDIMGFGYPDENDFEYAFINNSMWAFDNEQRVNVEVDECAEDDNFIIKMDLGEKVDTIKYAIMPGNYPPTKEYLELIAGAGFPFFKVEKRPMAIGFDGSEQTRGIYSVFIVGVDSEGKFTAGDVKYMFINHNVPEEWEPIVEKATYGEDVMASYYEGWTVPEYEVSFERNKQNPGQYRLVEAYGTVHPLCEKVMHNPEHKHYLYFDITDPDKANLDFSTLGIDMGDGCVYMNSLVNFYIDNEVSEENYSPYYGKYDTATRTLTFPARSIIVGESGYQNCNAYLANLNGAFKIVLPETMTVGSGVKEILDAEDANAPVVYYNTLGQRVATPEPGQLLIVRQGKSSKKTIFK